MIRVDLSIYQSHPIGDLMGRLMYGTITGADKILSLIKYNGCPHNGGEHSFSFSATKGDAIAFLNLLYETYYRNSKYIYEPKFQILDSFIKDIINDSSNKKVFILKAFIHKNNLE